MAALLSPELDGTVLSSEPARVYSPSLPLIELSREKSHSAQYSEPFTLQAMHSWALWHINGQKEILM